VELSARRAADFEDRKRGKGKGKGGYGALALVEVRRSRTGEGKGERKKMLFGFKTNGHEEQTPGRAPFREKGRGSPSAKKKKGRLEGEKGEIIFQTRFWKAEGEGKEDLRCGERAHREEKKRKKKKKPPPTSWRFADWRFKSEAWGKRRGRKNGTNRTGRPQPR